ncbi:hypothetical protein [Reichenbachiella sp.]|uniref:hypothetical protein n=1 Tax=Reichenbachiella sp. TaxID=2184521 RepID=UPI003BB19E3A
MQLQTVVSAAHTNSSNGTISLSGSFGQPLSNVDNETLSGGFYSAATDLLSTNLVPLIDVIDDYKFSQFDITNTDISIAADISDLDGIAYAAIWIRPIASAAFDSIPLTLESNNKYAYTLSLSDFDEMGIEYYFVAGDNTTRRRRHPATGSLFAYATDPQVTFPSTLISPGSSAEDYRMISIPYQIDQNEVATLLKNLVDLGDYDKSKWRLFSHDGGTGFTEYPNGSAQSLERGRGYWLLVNDKNNQTLNMGTNVTASANNQENLFTMNLQSGWNMIGNPYTVPISWENVRTYNSTVDIGTIKLFEDAYENGDELLAFQGGIVYLEGSDTSIEIPFSSQGPSGGRIKQEPFENDLSAENWELPLTLIQGDRRNLLGGIGMHSLAKTEKDHFDDHNPPRFASFLEMNFPHPEHLLGSFSRDIVKRQSQYKWQFDLNANENKPITIQWDNGRFGNNSVEIYLFDTVHRRLIDMRTTNTYTADNNARLEIYYGKDVLEEMSPEKSIVGVPYPNPVTDNHPFLTIPLVLSTLDNHHTVNAVIYSKEGRMIKELYKDELTPGLYHLEWDGVSDQGIRASSGMYFYHVIIRSGQRPAIRSTGKIFISK